MHQGHVQAASALCINALSVVQTAAPRQRGALFAAARQGHFVATQHRHGVQKSVSRLQLMHQSSSLDSSLAGALSLTQSQCALLASYPTEHCCRDLTAVHVWDCFCRSVTALSSDDPRRGSCILKSLLIMLLHGSCRDLLAHVQRLTAPVLEESATEEKQQAVKLEQVRV